MITLELKAGYSCNNNCVFCVWTGKRSRLGEPLPWDKVLRMLEEGRSRGAEGLVLAGGESAMHESFFPTIRKARDLSYKRVQIQTNGRVFCYPEFCKKAVDAGATHFAPALQGSNAPLHDFLTGTPGSFLQTVTGIGNLRTLGQTVLVHVVITKTNYRDLPDLMRLLQKIDVQQVQLAYVHAGGGAAANKEWLIPRYGMSEPWIKEAINIGTSHGIIMGVESVPFCALRGYEKFVTDPVIPKTISMDADGEIIDVAQARRRDSRARDERCDECLYGSVCEGPWREYTQRYGWSEFEPFLHGDMVKPASRDVPFVYGKNGYVVTEKEKEKAPSEDQAAQAVLEEMERLEQGTADER